MDEVLSKMYFCLWSGGAAGEVHCPQIDTQQLDRQIKAIMTEVIPFLKVGYPIKTLVEFLLM